jgi:hypothetical protein
MKLLIPSDILVLNYSSEADLFLTIRFFVSYLPFRMEYHLEIEERNTFIKGPLPYPEL